PPRGDPRRGRGPPRGSSPDRGDFRGDRGRPRTPPGPAAGPSRTAAAEPESAGSGTGRRAQTRDSEPAAVTVGAAVLPQQGCWPAGLAVRLRSRRTVRSRLTGPDRGRAGRRSTRGTG